MSAEAAVRGSMILATLAWAAGETMMRRSPQADRRARAAWTVAILLAAVHVVLAFHFVYGWSHETAVAETARLAAERFGVGWRGSIYVNYVFLAIWLADVCWWWVARPSHASRPRELEVIRFVTFVFMFVNGAVIFASGIGRLAGIAAVTAVLLASPVSRSRAQLA